ncbi:MAG: SMP-30/gluconolactonase/LRE family protein [Rhodospirillales bacterium]|nr:SMP-30/gluconolactonase/LRE family protein [Rhodospirillales bacterium]MDE2198682.1 SMP-30/gluconolactonase/LRE family protein [Rhodospirillales bacterium]MDE2575214.1 SMP-30/gluconolactonase/LRE family protein [Rhodospirillales bacterium]
MSLSPPPALLPTRLHAELPAALRRPIVSDWSRANKGGAAIGSFLEGPCFDPAGNLYLVDIPHGRLFRLAPNSAPDTAWSVCAEWAGEPNGLARHPDGRIFIADYRLGLLAFDPASGRVETVLARRNGESFKGLNDLAFARNGDLYFTDQGQTGLHDPTGRVFRLRADGRLDCLIANGPSPNGLVLSAAEDVLFVAMTRDNAVWRVPLLADGGTGKVGRFASFHGTSGPDGMAADADGNILLAHASLGAVFVLSPQGEPIARFASCRGATTTNLAFGGADRRTLYITESESGAVLAADWRVPGLPLPG